MNAMTSRLDATFLALSDPTRRAILARLARGDASVTELAEPFAISQPAISKHLKILERAGLISVGQDAQRRPRRAPGSSSIAPAGRRVSNASTIFLRRCSARLRGRGVCESAADVRTSHQTKGENDANDH
jgi:DNA-binding transcriptional ArsR family regulator